MTAAPRRDSGRYLLALGDSLAAGYEPSDGYGAPPVDPATGYPDRGYPGGYASDLAAARHLRLIDLGCPGETTASMTGTPANALCAQDYRAEFGASSQLAAALVFLGSHRGRVALVSFDIGANDMEACNSSGSPSASCLKSAAKGIARRLPPILKALKHALAEDDPGTRLLAMNYYDPFLGLAFDPGGVQGSAEAYLSLVLVDVYNGEIEAVYHGAGVPVADVAAAFYSSRTDPVVSYHGVLLTRNVDAVCVWTWMCPTSSSHQPDIHPDLAGYSVITGAFEKVLASS